MQGTQLILKVMQRFGGLLLMGDILHEGDRHRCAIQFVGDQRNFDIERCPVQANVALVAPDNLLVIVAERLDALPDDVMIIGVQHVEDRLPL